MSVVAFAAALFGVLPSGAVVQPERAKWQIDEVSVSLAVPQGYCANTDAAREYDKRQRGRSLPPPDVALFRCGEGDPQSYDYYAVLTMRHIPRLTLAELLARMGAGNSLPSGAENFPRMRKAIDDWMNSRSVAAFGGGQQIGSDERCVYSVYVSQAPAGSKVQKVAFVTCTTVIASRVTQFTRFMPFLDADKAANALAEVKALSLSVEQ